MQHEVYMLNIIGYIGIEESSPGLLFLYVNFCQKGVRPASSEGDTLLV